MKRCAQVMFLCVKDGSAPACASFHRRRSLPIHIAGMTATLAGMDSKTLITLSRSIDAVCGIAVIEVTNSTRRARNIWQRVGWVSGGIAQEFPSGN